MIWWSERTEDTLKRAEGKNQKIFKETFDEYEKGNKLKLFHVDVIITLAIHNKDIYSQLMGSKIKSQLNFERQKHILHLHHRC